MRSGTTAVVAPASCYGMKKRTLAKGVVLGAAVAAALVTVPGRTARGASGTWTGAVDATWGTAGNWIGGVPNATTDDATFFDASANTANLNITLGANEAVRSLTFNSNATSSVTLNIGNSNQLTIQGGVTGGDVVVAAGSHKIVGVAAATVQELKLGGSTTWNIQSGASLEVNARMIQNASSNSFTKTGDGTLILSADETGGTGQNLSGGGYVVQQGTLVFANRKAVGNTATPVTVSGGATIEWRDFGNGYNATAAKFTLQDGAHWLVTSATNATSTMSAGANSQLFLTSGSATIDTTTGPLTINDDINGAGGFTKTGTNLLILGDGGTSTYTGKTVVAAGRLKLSAGATLGNSPSVEVQAGAKFDVSTNASGGLKSFQVLGGAGHVTGAATLTAGTVAPGMVGTAGTLTFDTSLTLSGATLALDLSDPATGNNDLLAVTGALAVSSPTVVNVNRLGGALAAGTYTIATYGTLTTDAGTLATNLQLPQVRQGLTLDTTTPGSIKVTAGSGSAASLVWSGASSSNWNRTESNFVNGAAADQFFDWDGVTFDDSSSVNTVQVNGLVTPTNVTFANGQRAYTLTGTGNLNGVQTLTKNGTGTATLSVASANVGSVAVNAGTLTLANAGAYVIGSVTNAATLNVGDGATSGVGNLGSTPVTNSGTLVLNRPDDFTFGSVVSGSGTLVKSGAGTATVAGSNSYTGNTVVNAGTLRVTTSAALGGNAAGSAGSVTVNGGAVLDLAGSNNGLDLRGHGFTITGAGTGSGAIVNNSTANQQQNALLNVTLAGDAGVGGAGRLDIRAASGTGSLDLSSYTLTKYGAGQFSLVATNVGGTGNITVNAGTLSVETTTSLTSTGTLTAAAGTTLQLYRPSGGTITMPMALNGALVTDGGQANAVTNVNSPLTLGADETFQINNSSGFTFGGNVTASGGARSVTVTKTGTASSLMAFGGTTVDYGGSTGVTNSGGGGTIGLRVGATTSLRTTAVSLDSSARLDLTAGARLVLTGEPASTLVAQLSTGRNGGDWAGNGGIMSASAQAANDASRVEAIGWVVAGDVNLTGQSWGSITNLAATDIVAKVTYYGDLNLDGRVNGDDYALLDRFVAINGLGGTASARWVDGDVNYDGAVTSADFLLTDTAFGLQGGVLSPEFLAERQSQFGDAYVSELLAAVPEPGALGVVGGLAVAGTLRRRRPRNG